MSWFKVDDKLHSHPKRHRAGLRAMGLWVVAGSWCADHLMDGIIPEDMLSALGGKTSEAQALSQTEESGGRRDRIVARQSDSPEPILAGRLNGESDRHDCKES